MSKMVSTGLSSCYFKVLILLFIFSSQLFDKVQGGGSQYCLLSDGFQSPECGPSGINSSPEVLEENSIKGTGSSWWNATNMNFLVYVEKISDNIIIVPKIFFQFFIYSYDMMGSIAFSMDDAFNNCATVLASYLQSALLKQMSTLILPSLYGLLMILFSWLLVYYDSRIPGVFPPTPVSPKKHRMKSGHTFHLGYLLGLINGIIVFVLSFWEQIMH